MLVLTVICRTGTDDYIIDNDDDNDDRDSGNDGDDNG